MCVWSGDFAFGQSAIRGLRLAYRAMPGAERGALATATRYNTDRQTSSVSVCLLSLSEQPRRLVLAGPAQGPQMDFHNTRIVEGGPVV